MPWSPRRRRGSFRLDGRKTLVAGAGRGAGLAAASGLGPSRSRRRFGCANRGRDCGSRRNRDCSGRPSTVLRNGRIGNLLHTLGTPEPIKGWSLISQTETPLEIETKVVSRESYVAFQTAAVAIPRKRLNAELGDHRLRHRVQMSVCHAFS